MPRCVRNFWIDLDVDGKKTSVGTGPRSKDGGFDLTILMREEGSISDKQVRIRGFVNRDGELVLEGTSPKNIPLLVANLDEDKQSFLVKTKR